MTEYTPELALLALARAISRPWPVRLGHCGHRAAHPERRVEERGTRNVARPMERPFLLLDGLLHLGIILIVRGAQWHARCNNWRCRGVAVDATAVAVATKAASGNEPPASHSHCAA